MHVTVLVLAVSIASLALGIVCLSLLLRMRARNQKVERWLEKQILAIREELKLLALQPPPAQPARPPLKAARSTPQQHPTPVQSPQPPPQTETPDLTDILNEMLAGDQPYNFLEAVRALAPTLDLRRLTPCAGIDGFASRMLLEPGGDGLFAIVDGNTAELYPNYSRFSATLDPKPLFDGARHGGRVHSILAPALLERQADDTWLLIEKGHVQMRQGA